MSIPVQTHVINGELAAPVSDQYIDMINPSTGEMAGRGADGDAADVDSAVAAAKQAFTTWKDYGMCGRWVPAAILLPTWDT